MKIPNREKRDWSLLIFIVPVGIFLMMIAGQIAVRLVPNWTVFAGMQSNLDLKSAPQQQEPIQPISAEILTPLSWFDTFLTPNSNSGDNAVFPPFIVFEASATPTASASPSVTVTDTMASTPTVTATSTPTSTPSTPTPTKKPKPTDPTPAVCSDPNANNNGSPLPCTYYTSVPSTPIGTEVSPTPSGLTVGTPDGSVAGLSDGNYVVVDLSPFPIIVNGISDTNYDFVYYERATGGGVDMDRVILSISKDKIVYYVVFNWGDGIPDNNSNVGDVAGTEADNQHIDAAELYGTAQDTGILVDVDNAPSHPPAGSYQYLAIQAPTPTTGGDGADVDAIQVTEVPSPWP